MRILKCNFLSNLVFKFDFNGTWTFMIYILDDTISEFRMPDSLIFGELRIIWKQLIFL